MSELATPSPSAASAALDSPYKGLTYYSEHDAPYFFGRESETEIIVANLMASRLTLLYGESGVGKSSVLHAGAMRRLHQTARQNIEDWGQPEFVALSFRNWQNDPIAGLRDAIRTSVADVLPDVDPVEPTERLDEELFEWCERIDGDLVIVLDQFEEYFLYHPNEGAPGTFFVEFPRALNRGDLRVSFLIGIREDGLAKLDAFKGRIPNLFDNYLRIDHLSLKAARAAIEKPIEQWNSLHPGEEDMAVEEGLVDAVLEQVRAGQFFLGAGGAGTTTTESKNGRGNVIETPFLQLVMTRLWEEELAAGSRVLQQSTLERLGGAERIVRTHLDRVMGSLAFAEQDLAADIFRQLVTPSGTKIAHALSDLAEYAERPEIDLVPVIEHLSSSDVRVLRPVAPPPDQPGGLRYEIFHDVLAAAILDWRARWKQAETERELEESRKEQERERRRARTFRAVAAIAIIVAGIAALLGVWAFRQKDAAVRQKKTANSEELAAKSAAELGLEPRLSLAFALAAIDKKQMPDSEQALRVALAESRVRAMLRGHTSWVNTVRWSPDGRYVVTASDDKTARIWDSRTAELKAKLVGHTDFVNTASWSADGDRVVTAGDSTARIWGWRGNGKPVVLRVGPADKDCSDSDTCVSVAQFGGRRSQYVLTASFDNKLRVWDSRTGKLLWAKKLDDINIAAFDPSGTRILASGSLEGDIYEWQNPKAKPVKINAENDEGRHTQTDTLNGVVFSADGAYVVTGSEDKTIAVWNAHTGENLVRLFGPREGVIGVSMSPPPATKFVAAASKDGAIYLWDWHAENRLAKILGHTDIVSDVSFSPDGKTLASASGDRTSRLWAVPPVDTLVHKQPVKWAAWSPNGKYAVTATAECDSFADRDPDFICKAFVWDVADPNAQPRRVATLAKHTDWVTGAGFSPDNTKVVTGGDDDMARVWSVPGGRQLKVLEGHSDWLTSTSFGPDGKLVITSSLDGTARIWDWRKAKTISTIHGVDSIGSASFDPSGRYVLTTGGTPHDYTIKVWDWRKTVKKPFRTLRGHTGAVNYASWSPKGQYVVSASSDGTARVWDWRTQATLVELRGQAGALKHASFGPTGRYVVTVSTDGSTRVWEWRTANAATQVRWHVDVVHSGMFSPDGSRILTSSDDWSAAIFRCETCGALPQLVSTARTRVAHTVTPAELRTLLQTNKTPKL